MKTFLDCYPCFMRQALEAARMAGADERQQKAVLNRVLDALKLMGPSSTPSEMGDQIHRIVRQETGSGDPYRMAKEISTRRALAFYPRLKALLATAARPQWGVWIASVAAVLLGSQLGSRLMAEQIKPRTVKKVFGWVLLGVAALIIVKDVVLR